MVFPNTCWEESPLPPHCGALSLKKSPGRLLRPTSGHGSRAGGGCGTVTTPQRESAVGNWPQRKPKKRNRAKKGIKRGKKNQAEKGIKRKKEPNEKRINRKKHPARKRTPNSGFGVPQKNIPNITSVPNSWVGIKRRFERGGGSNAP